MQKVTVWRNKGLNFYENSHNFIDWTDRLLSVGTRGRKRSCVCVCTKRVCVRLPYWSAKQSNWLSHARPAPFPFPVFLFPGRNALPSCMLSTLAPDPIRVQSCVYCLFWTNRNSLAVPSIFLSISLSNQSDESLYRRIHSMEIFTSTEAMVLGIWFYLNIFLSQTWTIYS